MLNHYIDREYLNSKQDEYDMELSKTDDVYEIRELLDEILNLYKNNDSTRLISLE